MNKHVKINPAHELRACSFFLALLLILAPVLSGYAGLIPVAKAWVAAGNFLLQQSAVNGPAFIYLKQGGEFRVPANQIPDYFIFNLVPAGFIIISADDAVYPVLGYSFINRYDPATIHPAFSAWMAGYSRQIGYVRQHNLPPDSLTRSAWNCLLAPATNDRGTRKPLNDVAPLVTTTWDQNFPYNADCPADPNAGGGYYGHVPAGCTATAMAQVMYYWRYPAHGTGNHCIVPPPVQYGPQCVSFDTAWYGWNGMVSHPETECIPAATLCYQAGVAVDMQYSAGNSISNIAAVPDAMKNFFNYDPDILLIEKSFYSLSDWLSTIKGNLDNKWPVIYYGEGNGDSHNFICDGYQNNDFFHFNWGWGGLYDGYFYLNNLNPGGMNFSLGQAAVINIHPRMASWPPYCSGITTLNYPDFGSIEDGSGPTLNYLNMADCRWLISPADSIRNISLHFIRFHIGPADMVRIYDGGDITSPLLATLAGNSLPPDVTSSGKQMVVRLTSMLSTTSAGFLAEYTADPYPYCRPDSIYTATSSVISDGSGPQNYRNDTFCLWYISPMPPQPVTLTFSDFDTEPGQDVVTVFQTGSSVPLATYSGSYTTPPLPVTSVSGSMVVQFSTNKTNRGKGWSASYSSLAGTPEHPDQQGVSIIPNPVEDAAEVRFTSFTHGKPVSLYLFDITGRLVRCQSCISSPWTFHREGLQPGVYLLKIMGNSGRGCLTGKLMVVKGNT